MLNASEIDSMIDSRKYIVELYIKNAINTSSYVQSGRYFICEKIILNTNKRKIKVIPFSGQYAMNLGVHIEGLSNGKEEIS